MILLFKKFLLMISLCLLLFSCSFITDIFTDGPFTLIIDNKTPELGSIEVSGDSPFSFDSEGNRIYHYGAKITLKAIPSSGSGFGCWQGAYSTTEATNKFEIIHDTTVSPQFAQFDKTYLVMVYAAAANSLEADGFIDINSMELGLYNANVYNKVNLKTVVLYDRMDSEDFSTNFTGDNDWAGTRLYEIKSDNDNQKTNSKIIDKASSSLGQWRTGTDDEEDMGDISTLKNFIYWAKETYPEYTNHVLILWNHGSGLLSAKSICFDEETKKNNGGFYGLNGQLTVPETAKLLNDIYDDDKLAIIGFDACLMGMYEIAYQFRNCAKYFVASEATEFGGWNYNEIFSDEIALESNDTFAKSIVEAYRTKGGSNTLSAFNLSYAQTLKNQIDTLASSLQSAFVNPSWAEAIINARDNAVHFFNQNNFDYNYNFDLFSSQSPEADYISYPYFDIGYLCDNLQSSFDSDSDIYKNTSEIKNTLKNGIEFCWHSSRYSSKNKNNGIFGQHLPYGLSIFWSYDKSMYQKYHFYYSKDIITHNAYTFTLGEIEAANTSDDGVVNTWKEFLDSIYSN